jgi:hypothetical protein
MCKSYNVYGNVLQCKQECTNPRCQFTVVTKFCKVAPGNWGSALWNCPHVIVLTPRILSGSYIFIKFVHTWLQSLWTLSVTYCSRKCSIDFIQKYWCKAGLCVEILIWHFMQMGAHGSTVGWGIMLQAGRAWVHFPVGSLEFFHLHVPLIEMSNRNISWGVKAAGI